MKRWTLWVPLTLFLGFCVLAGYQLTQPKDDFVVSRMIGKPLPDFDLHAASLDRPALASSYFHDGKPHLLNVFASWCIPCAAEAPQLEALRRRGADIAGIAIRDRPEDVADYLTRYGNPYSRIGSDDLSQVQLDIGSSGVPETFVIDGKGIIRYQHIGDIRPDDVPLMIGKLREAEQ